VSSSSEHSYFFKENTPIFKGKQKSRKNRENTPVFKENTPIFKGKQKSRKNRENTPIFKVYFKINIFSKILPCFSVGPLQRTYEFNFRQTKKHLKIHLSTLFLLGHFSKPFVIAIPL
jgi:hypothetical protein